MKHLWVGRNVIKELTFGNVGPH